MDFRELRNRTVPVPSDLCPAADIKEEDTVTHYSLKKQLSTLLVTAIQKERITSA